MRRALGFLLTLACAGAAGATELDDCLAASDLPRVARVVDPGGRVVYARVVEARDGHVTRAATIAAAGTPLTEVFARAARPEGAPYPVADDAVCAVVDLPEAGDTVSKDDEVVVIESVKAASDILAPIDGEIVEVNEALADAPATVNEDAISDGWFFKIKASDPSQMDDYMDEAAYKAMID